MDGFKYEQRGYCPCCERPTVFSSEDPWFRDHLLCASCSSLVRERALALIISETMPNWRVIAIHESSPVIYYLYSKMMLEALGYIGTHYLPDEELGKEVRGFRNENLEGTDFPGWQLRPCSYARRYGTCIRSSCGIPRNLSYTLRP